MAAYLRRYLYNPVVNALFGTSTLPDTADLNEDEYDISVARFQSDRYSPSVQDVLDVKRFLSEERALPPELVDAVVDFAEYWPHTSSVTSHDPSRPLIIRSGPERENRFILRSWPLGYNPSTDTGDLNDIPWSEVSKPWPFSDQLPDEATEEVLRRWTAASLPRGKHPCRKIVFKLKSHDQGWGGGPGQKGTYKGSYTWFDTGLERLSASKETIPNLMQIPLDLEDTNEPILVSLRTIAPESVLKPAHTSEEPAYEFKHELEPYPHALQCNIVANKNSREHTVTWSHDDNILPESLEGNELEAIGRGRQTGTGEYVRNMQIGDVVTVWAKARFQGWANTVEQAQIDVYWAV